jgi:hypothetical protein
MLGNEHEAPDESSGGQDLNCEQSLKPFKLQREDEISLSVNATKVEKIKGMEYGVNLSSFNNGSFCN